MCKNEGPLLRAVSEEDRLSSWAQRGCEKEDERGVCSFLPCLKDTLHSVLPKGSPEAKRNPAPSSSAGTGSSYVRSGRETSESRGTTPGAQLLLWRQDGHPGLNMMPRGEDAKQGSRLSLGDLVGESRQDWGTRASPMLGQSLHEGPTGCSDLRGPHLGHMKEWGAPDVPPPDWAPGAP